MEVVRSVGDLVALSHASTPHKYFISALVHRRVGISLPVELDLSLGMRRYSVLITGERESHPLFRRELGRYVLPEPGMEVASKLPDRRYTDEIPRMEKGKQLLA